MIVENKFGEFLQKHRKLSGYNSQRKLAEATGISSATISRIESEIHKPTPDTIKILSDHLNSTTYSELMDKVGYSNNKNKEGNDYMKDWSNEIKKSWDNQRKVDNTLSPSKMQINSIASFATNINNTVQLIKNASDMAHEGIIDFEMAQKIIDNQKEVIKDDVKYLKGYLDIE